MWLILDIDAAIVRTTMSAKRAWHADLISYHQAGCCCNLHFENKSFFISKKELTNSRGWFESKNFYLQVVCKSIDRNHCSVYLYAQNHRSNATCCTWQGHVKQTISIIRPDLIQGDSIGGSGFSDPLILVVNDGNH